jgi:hypothetical protein
VTTRPDDPLYVYALVEKGLAPALRIGRHALQVVQMSGVGVVVDRRPRAAPDPDSLKEQHALLLALARRVDPILPARFGSWISRGDLVALIGRQADSILDALARVRGRRQMTIRVFGSQGAPGGIGRTASSGTEYLALRRARAHAVPPDVEVIRGIIGNVAAERAAEGPPGTLAVYHLIPSGAVAGYRKQASTLQSIFAPRRVTVSGPWPPFAFAPELF